MSCCAGGRRCRPRTRRPHAGLCRAFSGRSSPLRERAWARCCSALNLHCSPPQTAGVLAICSSPGSQEATAQGWHVIVVPRSSPYSVMRVPILCVMSMPGQVLRVNVCDEQTMVRHKSRLEREKEAADARKKASPEEAGSQGRQPNAQGQTFLPGEVSMQAAAVCLVEVHCSWYACAAPMLSCMPARARHDEHAHPAAWRETRRAI